MTRAWLVVAVLHIGAALSYAEDQSARVVYRNAELHYAIELPVGWKEIPEATFEQLRNALPTAAAKFRVRFVAGFQRAEQQQFGLPYVLVQHDPGVPDSLQQLADALSTEAKSQATAEKLKAMEGMVKSYTVEGPRIDAKNRMVWLCFDAASPMRGKMKCQSLVRPGRSGTVILQCYSAADSYATTAPVFEEMARQLKFDDGYDFVEKARSPHSFRTIIDLAPGLICAFLVIAGYGSYLLLRRLSIKSR
jgi:hypothetical protein